MGGKVSSKMAAVGRVVQVRLSNWSIYRTASTLGTQVSSVGTCGSLCCIRFLQTRVD